MKSILIVCSLLMVLHSPFANVNADRAYKPTDAISNGVPQWGPLAPDVVVLEPEASTVTVNSEILALKILVVSRALPLTSVTITRNQRVVHSQKMENETAENRRRFSRDYPIRLQEGLNVIEVTASNEKASSRPQIRTVTYESSMPKKPNLLVLSIGISGYKDNRVVQPQASRNAEAFAKLLDSQENSRGLYQDVIPEVLTDEKASRLQIVKSLGKLNSAVRSDADVRVLFLSGAFLADRSDNTYFLSPDYELKTDPEISSLNLSMIFTRLADVRGPILVFLDSSSFSSAGVRGVLRLINKYSFQGNFFVYLCCDSKDSGVTSPTSGHSFFVTALLEGLKGKAIGKDRVIDTTELESWLKSQVPLLSGGAQLPVFLGNQKPLIVFTPAARQP